MRKYVLAAVIILISVYAFSQESSSNIIVTTNCEPVASPVSEYKSSYVIIGKPCDDVKIQISLKYNIFHPFNLGLYFGYTQDMFWALYEFSSPFREIDFNPEIFWRLESGNNIFGNAEFGSLDYLQFGLFEHKSDGRDGDEDRGYNRCYIQFQIGAGEDFKIGFNGKIFYLISKAENNNDIENYIGSYEAEIFLRTQGNHGKIKYDELYFRFGSGGGIFGFDFAKGWQELGLKIRPLIFGIRPYIQLWHGYGESMISYNKMNENSYFQTAIRIGIVFE